MEDKRSIRVLLIAPALEILGGQAVQASQLIANLRREPSIAVGFLPISQLPGVLARFEQVRYVRTLLALIVYLCRLAARAPRYDILHIFSAGYTSYLLWSLPAILWGRLLGKIVILHYHDGRAEEHLRNWITAIPSMRLADAIVTPSGYVVDIFARFGMSVQKISNTLDMRPLRFRQRRPLRPVFLHNRILEPLYNVDCTLRAFEIIQTHHPEATLTIAHDGVSRPHLELLARELGLRNTRFIGRVPHDRVAELYDAADIYLTNPDFDCMPGSILECFACGLPVIATDVGGIPYIATHEETALLIPRDDHEALAAASLRLLADPDLVDRLTARAYQECAKYDEDTAQRQWLALYRKLRDRKTAK